MHEDRHETGESDDPQQRVLELRAALKICAPVAWVHVSDADEDGRADEGSPLFPKAGLMVRDLYRAVNIGKREIVSVRGGAIGRI